MYEIDKKILKTVQEIKHCPCNLEQSCPCDKFIEEDECRCGLYSKITEK